MSSGLGVCSWSLRPDSPADLARKLAACGLDRVQLALEPLRDGRWDEAETLTTLRAAGIAIGSGMMSTRGEDYSTLDTIRETGGLRPDAHWEENLAIAEADAALARRLGLGLVTFHAGFLPEGPADPERARLLERLRRVCGAFQAQGVRLGLETGQERAATLLEVLSELDHPAAGVNFDPANMILYGMGDPVEALGMLREHVLQIHVKDALASEHAGAWGSEVPAGTGAVDWAAFFAIARELDVPLMIEREAGEQRVEDIARARELVALHGGAA